MKTYQTFASTLEALLAGNEAVRIHVDGYMPLVIEAIGHSGDGGQLVALSHTTVQNGDLMRDPEIVFEIVETGSIQTAEPLSYRNDFMAILQEAYRYDGAGRRTHVVPRLKNDLRGFAKLWFRNLRDQGFLTADAVREVLA